MGRRRGVCSEVEPVKVGEKVFFPSVYTFIVFVSQLNW